MPRSIVVIQGHPDPDPKHYCRALAAAYVEGARAAGHTVAEVDVANLDFPLLRSAESYAKAPVPEALASACEQILAADHLVLIFPLWLGTLPALTKGFLEQVLRPGIAFEDSPGGWPKGKLKGRSARVVVTMGMPALVFRWWFMAHGLKTLERNILGFVGFRPIRDTVLGMVEAVSETRRKRWLEMMREYGRRGV